MREQVLALLAKYMPGPFKPSGPSNVLTRCPFHKGGQEKTASFSINVEKAIFNCFTCHESGGIKRLLLMLGVPRVTADLELIPLAEVLEKNKELSFLFKKNHFVDSNPFQAKTTLPETILSIYDWMPLRLVEDGFDPALLQEMQVGFDRENLRITYPIRDMYGNLAGFSGGSGSPDQLPRYKVYQGGRNIGNPPVWTVGTYGKWFDDMFPGYYIENHNYLWNYDRVYPRLLAADEKDNIVYVVEGFKACLWMIQNGFKNTVALMGSSITENQQQMLHRLGGTVVLCLDHDLPGIGGTLRIGSQLWKPMYGRIKVMNYPKDAIPSQPDDYEPDALRQLVSTSVPFSKYVNGK